MSATSISATSSQQSPAAEPPSPASPSLFLQPKTLLQNAPPVPREPYTTFTARQKGFLVLMASLAASFSGFASNIFFPAIPTMANALNTTIENINLSVTTYMIFQAISPTFWGAISDVYGRRITLMCTFVVFLGACIGLALSQHFYQLLILRCLQSTGSASTIAIGAGIIGDVTTREERGGFMGIFQTGLLLPLAIGPVLGGIFATFFGWRAIFWFLVIYAGIFWIALVILLPETLRAIVGNGARHPPRRSRALLERWTATRQPLDAASSSHSSGIKAQVDFFAPIRIVFFPEVFFVLLFLSLHYAAWQMALTAQSALFESTYNLSEVFIGLTFLANGVGTMLGTLTTGKFLDRDYKRMRAKFEGEEDYFPIETARLRTVWLWSPIQWISVLMFGWTIDRGVHIAAPIVASFLLAWSAMSAQSVISTFLVDIFPQRSASATAALNLARCLMGAAATATVNPSIRRMGTGWTFTMWTGFLVLSLGLVAVQMKYGGEWRRKRIRTEKEKSAALDTNHGH